MSPMRAIWNELRRRKIFRVAVVYAATTFVILQAADIMLPRLGVPEWAMSLIVVLVVLGFPVALILAWALELTPDGVRVVTARAPSDRAEPPPSLLGKRTVLLTGLLVVLGIGLGTGWFLRPVPVVTPAESRETSIAVLPFEVLGADQTDTFAEGLHQDLLTRLSNIGDLQVTSSTSVRQFRDTTRPVPEIAAALGVRWIVEGTVQQVGTEIQLNAQLVDAHSDSHLWARTYRRSLSAVNLFAIQAEITEDITRSLRARLTPEVRQRLDEVPTQSLLAYELGVRAMTLLRQRTESSMRRAMDLFEDAIEADPDYAYARAGLADARFLLAWYGFAAPEVILPQARAAAQQARELDPGLAYAYQVLGTVSMLLEHDGPSALRALERAHALSSEDEGWLAWIHTTLGRLETGIDLMEKEVERNPFAPAAHASMATLYLADGSVDKALEHARKAGELSPGLGWVHLAEGQALLARKEYEQSIAALERALSGAIDRHHDEVLGWLALTHARAGEVATATEFQARIADSDHYFARALANSALGESDRTYELLGQVRWTDMESIYIRYSPLLEEIRSDPRYPELVREVNRWWGLEPDGSLPQD